MIPPDSTSLEEFARACLDVYEFGSPEYRLAQAYLSSQAERDALKQQIEGLKLSIEIAGPILSEENERLRAALTETRDVLKRYADRTDTPLTILTAKNAVAAAEEVLK